MRGMELYNTQLGEKTHLNYDLGGSTIQIPHPPSLVVLTSRGMLARYLMIDIRPQFRGSDASLIMKHRDISSLTRKIEVSQNSITQLKPKPIEEQKTSLTSSMSPGLVSGQQKQTNPSVLKQKTDESQPKMSLFQDLGGSARPSNSPQASMSNKAPVVDDQPFAGDEDNVIEGPTHHDADYLKFDRNKYIKSSYFPVPVERFDPEYYDNHNSPCLLGTSSSF